MHEEEKISTRDGIALMLLKDFIKEGYPALDPIKQVDAAYRYADAIMGRRSTEKAEEPTD